jgi:hypothetical protein
MNKKNKYDFDFKNLIVDKVIKGRLSDEKFFIMEKSETLHLTFDTLFLRKSNSSE